MYRSVFLYICMQKSRKKAYVLRPSRCLQYSFICDRGNRQTPLVAHRRHGCAVYDTHGSRFMYVLVES